MSGRKERERRREERLRRESEAEARERRSRMVKLASAAGFLAIAVVLVLIVISQTQTDGGDVDLEGVSEVEEKFDGIPQRGLVLGDPSAKVLLVEFGDLQCPVCKDAAENHLPSIIDSRVRRGEARLEFRNFVILGPESQQAAAAAIAAAKQNRGWQFIDLFYRNQGREHSGYITDEFMTAVARGAGVPDIARWDHERRSNRVKRQVNAQTREAEDLGLGGTPSFLVEGPATAGLEPLGGWTSEELGAAITAAG